MRIRAVWSAGLGLIAVLALQEATSAAVCNIDGARCASVAQYNRGIRSQVGFVTLTSASTGVLVMHYMQVSFDSSGEVMNWMTYKGQGYPGCPSYYGSAWKLAAVYFADDGPSICVTNPGWPYYTGSDDNVPFKASFGDCGGSANRWRVFTENVQRDCIEDLNSASGSLRLYAQSWYSPTIRLIDVHFDDLNRMNTSGQWVSWANGDDCADTGYRVRIIAADDVWLEKG